MFIFIFQMTSRKLFGPIQKKEVKEGKLLLKIGKKEPISLALNEEDLKWKRVWEAFNEEDIEILGQKRTENNYAMAILKPRRGKTLGKIITNCFQRFYLRQALQGKSIPGYKNLVVIGNGSLREKDPRIDWYRLQT